MILQLLRLCLFLVVYQIVFLSVLVLIYHARGGMDDYRVFLFCLSFPPFLFLYLQQTKRTAPTVLGSDRFVIFFCLVRARVFMSGRQQILTIIFISVDVIDKTSKLSMKTLEFQIVSQGITSSSLSVPRGEIFSYPRYITHRNFCNSIY